MTSTAEQQITGSSPIPPDAQAVLLDTRQATLGMLWVLQAAATIEYQNGEITQANVMDGLMLQGLLLNHEDRLQELVNEIEAAIALQIENIGHFNHIADPNGGTGEAVFTYQPPTDLRRSLSTMFIGYFSELAVEVVENQEKIKEMEVVMVAGHQGSGKGEVIKTIEAAGYHVLSMSQIVREVVAAWGLRNTETIDKIVGGQIFKEYFGPDILVLLGLQYAASQGIQRVVIDGPRVIEEATAVTALGGKVIGIVNDSDYENDVKIRRQRIEERGKVDAARAQDVVKFDQREASESGRVKSILETVEPQNMIVNGPTTTLAELRARTELLIQQL